MNLMEKLMCFLVIGIVFLASHCTAPSVDGSCKSDLCYAGEYCKGLKCLECEYGFYNSEPAHKDVSCKPWTQKSGVGWTISKEGNKKMDREWECAPGYEETNSSGITECREIKTQPTPTSVSSTSNREKSNTTDSTKKISNDSQENNSEKIINIVVPVGIITVLIIILIVIIICLKKRIQQACTKCNRGRKKQNTSSNDSKNKHQMEPFLNGGDADNNAEGSDSPSSKYQNKKDDGTSGQTDNQNKNPPIKQSGPETKGLDSKNQNKNEDNAQTVVQINDTQVKPTSPGNDKNISSNNSKKPSKNDSSANGEYILDTSMSETVLGENSKTSNLLNALEDMFKSLCKKLGVTDGNKIMDGLKLKLEDNSQEYTLKFTKCLLKWISSPAFENDRVLILLNQLIKLLKNIERNDIVHNFYNISEGVTKIILQDALEETFENLNGKLKETDGNKVMDELKLKPVDAGLRYKQKFVKCLLEWISSAKNDGEILGLLVQLKSKLEKIDRKDIVQHFDKIIEGVTRIIGYRDNLSKLPDEAGRDIK